MFGKMFMALLLSALVNTLGVKKADPINWSSAYRLSWSDFKGNPDPNSGNAALTSSTISFKYSQSGTDFKYWINCTFDRNASWGRVKTPYILSHEQAHFDISEIFARTLNKNLKRYVVNEATINNDITAIYKKVVQEHAQLQSDYDQQTDHSKIADQQAIWVKKIKKDLDALKEYANYEKAK